jgi:hypothetical protein
MGSREVAAHTIPLCSVSCELQWQRTKRRFPRTIGKGPGSHRGARSSGLSRLSSLFRLFRLSGLSGLFDRLRAGEVGGGAKATRGGLHRGLSGTGDNRAGPCLPGPGNTRRPLPRRRHICELRLDGLTAEMVCRMGNRPLDAEHPLRLIFFGSGFGLPPRRGSHGRPDFRTQGQV